MTARKPESFGMPLGGAMVIKTEEKAVNGCANVFDNSCSHSGASGTGRLKGWEADPAPAIMVTGKQGIQTRILPPLKCRKARRTRKSQTGATEPGRDTGVLPTIGIPTPPLNGAGTSTKIPQGAFIANGHTVERVDPVTRIRHTGSAESSGDQGATSLNGMAHPDGVLDTKTGMLGRDHVTSKSAMNVTPHGQR